MKEMFNLWDAKFLFNHYSDPKTTKHVNDGLIFTLENYPYYPGPHCYDILKWKPDDRKSISFNLRSTPNKFIYQLLTSDSILFDYLVVENEPT